MLLLLVLLVTVFADDSIVQTAYGPIQGVVYSTYRKFEGIPYASPPVSSMRWKNPVPPTPWSSALPTQSFKPGCPQLCDLPPHTCPYAFSEDCLYLNVYTPLPKPSEPLPVLVNIHGGHFDQGTGGCVLFDGGNFVTKGGVILVNINYRLGVLGWLVTDELPGNFGFRDQQLALRWVQQNIAQFGGDPNKVTIFGQSAGGTSIRAHLVSPASKGLFHKAMIQSDPLAEPMESTKEALDTGNWFLQAIGCNNTDCLRLQPIGVLLELQVQAEKKLFLSHPLTILLPLNPTMDGKLIPYHWMDAIKSGHWNNVPLIIGSMSQDALLFIFKAQKTKMTTVEYEGILTFIFKQHVIGINELYPPPLVGDKRPLLSVLGTDYVFTCSIRHQLALINARFPGTPTYLYQWNHALSWDGWGPDYPFCVGKVCHGSEVPFEFDPPELKNFANITADEKVLSTQFIRYITNFAKNSDPNVGQPVLLNWPVWRNDTLKNIKFQTPANQITTGLLKTQCDFWDSLGYEWGW